MTVELRVLSKEEKSDAWGKGADSFLEMPLEQKKDTEMYLEVAEAIAHKAALEELKEIVKWGNEICPHTSSDEIPQLKRECPECWQELINAVQNEKILA